MQQRYWNFQAFRDTSQTFIESHKMGAGSRGETDQITIGNCFSRRLVGNQRERSAKFRFDLPQFGQHFDS